MGTRRKKLTVVPQPPVDPDLRPSEARSGWPFVTAAALGGALLSLGLTSYHTLHDPAPPASQPVPVVDLDTASEASAYVPPEPLGEPEVQGAVLLEPPAPPKADAAPPAPPPRPASVTVREWQLVRAVSTSGIEQFFDAGHGGPALCPT